MPQISIIKKSDIQEARRFDAEFFKPEFLKRVKILKQNFSFLDKFITSGSYGILPKSDDYIEEGLPLIRGKDLRRNDIEIENLVKVPENYYSEKYKVSKGDLLILVKGATIAFPDGVLLMQKDIGNAIFNGSIFRIKLNKNINKYFLYAFMTSRYFTFQKEREVANNGIEYNSLNTIKKYLIPNFPQSFQLQIEKIVKSAYEKQTQSKQLYKEAEEMLLKELDLLDYKPEHTLNFETTKNEINEVKRFDADFFQPFYQEVESRIKLKGFVLMKDICSKINYGTVPTSPYTTDGSGTFYIKGLNLKNIQIKKDKLDKIENTEKLPDKFYTKKGDIIISQMGTVGDVGVISKDEENWLFASFTIRARLKNFNEFNPLFIGLYIQNVAKRYYLLRNIAQASVRQNTDLPTIKNMYIPLINPKIQKQIVKKIQESHKLRKESKELLEEAKKRVEEEIEKGK